MGTYEVIRAEDGRPKRIREIPYPFAFKYDKSRVIQILKTQTRTVATMSLTPETILFKAGATITYPLDAHPVPVNASIDDVHDYDCIVAPGDSFKVSSPGNIDPEEAILWLHKIAGTDGNQDICHNESFVAMKFKPCELVRTEEGVPEGMVCTLSLHELFDPENFYD